MGNVSLFHREALIRVAFMRIIPSCLSTGVDTGCMSRYDFCSANGGNFLKSYFIGNVTVILLFKI